MLSSIYIGYDPREVAAFVVARHTIRKNLNAPVPIRGVVLKRLQEAGLYTRETEVRTSDKGTRQLWDKISNAPMSTEFAISRFLVPTLAKTGWALFTDSDVMIRAKMTLLEAQLDTSKAVMCVKHDHRPSDETKMDGQVQTSYPKKNWSSFMAFNCGHPSNAALTPEYVNQKRGIELHQFCWLREDEIGELDPSWNVLVGHGPVLVEPKCAHFTYGVPDMPGYEDVHFADEWHEALLDAVGENGQRAAILETRV